MQSALFGLLGFGHANASGARDDEEAGLFECRSFFSCASSPDFVHVHQVTPIKCCFLVGYIAFVDTQAVVCATTDPFMIDDEPSNTGTFQAISYVTFGYSIA